MIKQFVSYEIARQLKEKGFNEDCLGFWESFDESWNNYSSWANIDIMDELDNERLVITLNELRGYYNNITKAPLYQQVIDWFREKHFIDICMNLNLSHEYSAHIYNRFHSINQGKDDISNYIVPHGKDYYKVLIKAIEEALKLI